MPFNTNNMLAKKAMSGEGSRKSVVPGIPLSEICVRYKNKYIIGYEDSTSIKESIEKDGLIEPITINEIEAYLNSKDIDLLANEARQYYNERLERGFRYFITTGHRRFYAYCSLAVDRDIHSAEDLDDRFYDEIKEIIKKNDAAAEEGDYAGMNKYASIKAFIVRDSVEEERERYNVANLDQRITKDFEIVDNMIDEMKEKGIYDQAIDENKTLRIGKMTDRAVMDNLKKLGIATSGIKTAEEAKEKLMNADPSDLPGYQSDLNTSISKYIYDTRRKKIAVTSVNRSRKILETLDRRLIEFIYSGRLEYKNAIDMLSYYNKLSKADINDICKQIKSGEFNPSATKAKYSDKEEKRKIPLSGKDWELMVRQMIDGSLSIEEAKKKLKSLNLL